MVNKSSLAKKLASYSAFASTVIAVSREADAQIITTEVNPNITIAYYLPDYKLDLNNDGITDFDLYGGAVVRTTYNSYDGGGYTKFYSGSFVICKPYVSNSIVVSTSNHINAKPLHFGDVISPKTVNWKQVLAPFKGIYSSTFYSTHLPNGEYYVGLKFLKSGHSYYGWARVYVGYLGSFAILKEYGYNATPDSSITAGNTGCKFKPITPVVTFTGDSLQSTTANKYQWFLDDSLLANDTSGFIIPVDTGYYTVLTTDSNGCLSQSTVMYDTVVNISTGVSPFILTYDAYIYSYNKLLHVIIYDNKLPGSNVFIYNIMGQLVFSAKLTSAQTEIDMADFTAGVYVVKVSGNVSSIVKKIIVE